MSDSVALHPLHMAVALDAVLLVTQDPTSDVYRKALEMTSKAPGLHAELQKQLREAQVRCAPEFIFRFMFRRLACMPSCRSSCGRPRCAALQGPGYCATLLAPQHLLQDMDKN